MAKIQITKQLNKFNGLVSTSKDRVTISIQKARKRIVRRISKSYANLSHRIYWARIYITIWRGQHGATLALIVISLLIGLTVYVEPSLRDPISAAFVETHKLDGLRSLMLSIGSVLVGVAAIAFSLVMFAMQINIERMPHGLFRWFSKDLRILTSFGGTLLLAISIACASLIPNASWAAKAVLVTAWATVLIFVLFMYAYRRALLLINPIKQLDLIVRHAKRQLNAWERRSERARPLLEPEEDDDANQSPLSTSGHDISRAMYFMRNAHWDGEARKAMQYAISFARAYAEKGDHDISRSALQSLIEINCAYVKAKGKTFFANQPFFDNPMATDGFINSSLELLIQLARQGAAKNDEILLEQILKTLASLVEVYSAIDYSDSNADQTHAHLAVAYLWEAVQLAVKQNMIDVVMEGVRLMGHSASVFLATGNPDSIAVTVENIGTVGCVGLAQEKHRPITLTAVEQIANLTFVLLQRKSHYIGYAAGRLKQSISLIAKLFLELPNTSPLSVGSNCLEPYYSGTSQQALLARFVALINHIAKTDISAEDIECITRNFANWSEGFHDSEKELFVTAIRKKSLFALKLVHWVTHVSEVLLVLSSYPDCREHTRDELRKHAISLIWVLSWVPDEKELIRFAENCHMTESLFELAMNGHNRGCSEFSEEAQLMLVGWAFKAGKHQTGWGIFERSTYGLAALALSIDPELEVARLKSQMSGHLKKPNAPNQEIRDRTARKIRERAETLYREGHWSSRIEYAMGQLDENKLRRLLHQLADLLSPDTAGEPVRTDPF